MKSKRIFKSSISVFLCLVLIFTSLPMTAKATSTSTSVADPQTLDTWNTWFSEGSSRYAGGVFTDKSVYTGSEAINAPYFSQISDKLNFGKDNFGNENFLVAMSALGSNSEILGYESTPTDTMIVLDASNSMGQGTGTNTALDEMVDGANQAIIRLLALNRHNRVGVVVYNGDAGVLLPLARYTTTNADGKYIEYKNEGRNSGSKQNRIYIASGVQNSENTLAGAGTTYIAQNSGTYTQGGFYTAAQQLLNANPVIDDGKIQGGTKRIPIVVLMSDGQPSYRTNAGSPAVISKYTAATKDNCDKSGYIEDDITAFSTMLTAAWMEREITEHYGEDALVYTLGYNLDLDDGYAHNVLDPTNPNNLYADRYQFYANTYLSMEKGETKSFKYAGGQDFSVTRQSDPAKVTSLDYVDQYWQTGNANQLTNAFNSIVDKIVIQSRYYSTYVGGSEHNQDGFISFTDEIGSYMEVKNVKGFYLGGKKLVTGGMFAEYMTTGKVSADGEKYTDAALQGFDTEIMMAIEERFKVDTSTAALLVENAKHSGTIAYNKESGAFSNYIAWYADEDCKFIAPYGNSDGKAVHGAKYLVKSYFYMGDVTQNHIETSMLYALVRVREDLTTGRQIVDIDIPASLLPMVTYTISVNGDTFGEGAIQSMTCEQKQPMSLLYEVGLDSEITPYNIDKMVDGKDFRKDKDGNYVFYTNRWRYDNGETFKIPAPENVNPHVFEYGLMDTTISEYIPSLKNERYYYTTNTPILDASYQVYTGAKPTSGGKYYIKKTWVETDGSTASYKTAYNPIAAKVLADEKNIIQIPGKDGWFIQKDTPRFYFGEEVHNERYHVHKEDNKTGTLGWVNYPYVVYHDCDEHTGYHILDYHGNNGTLSATAAQGIAITKKVEQEVPGVEKEFTFTVQLTGNGLDASYPVHIEKADGTTVDMTAAVTGGELQVTLSKDDTAYITGIPAETQYVVEENYHSHYTGHSTNNSGVIEKLKLSEVEFVNSPTGFGSLLVEKM